MDHCAVTKHARRQDDNSKQVKKSQLRAMTCQLSISTTTIRFQFLPSQKHHSAPSAHSLDRRTVTVLNRLSAIPLPQAGPRRQHFFTEAAHRNPAR